MFFKSSWCFAQDINLLKFLWVCVSFLRLKIGLCHSIDGCLIKMLAMKSDILDKFNYI